MTRELQRYSGVAIVLHWVIAVLIIANVVLALSVDSLPDGWVRPVIDTHKSIGMTVLGLVLLRILWRISHAPPPLPDLAVADDALNPNSATRNAKFDCESAARFTNKTQ